MPANKTQRTTNRQNDLEKSISPLIAELSKITGKIDNIQDKFDILQDRVELTDDKVEKLNEQTKGVPTSPPKSPWWVLMGQILTVPAIVVLMLLQLSQASLTGPQNEKTIAETQKINTEELKTRAELQKLLDDLAIEKSKGVEAYEQQLSIVMPKIQEALQKLSELESESSRSLVVENLYKSILVIIFVQAIGFFLSIFEIIWPWLTSTIVSIYLLFFFNRPNKRRRLSPHNPSDSPNFSDKENVSIQQSKRRPKSKSKRSDYLRYYSVIAPSLANIPNIVRLLVTIFVFTTLVIPLFDLISLSLGYEINFSSVLNHLWKLDIRGAVEILRGVLFEK